MIPNHEAPKAMSGSDDRRMRMDQAQSEHMDARPLTEDEIKELILKASSDFERYTARVIARQRKQINALEGKLKTARAALEAAPEALVSYDTYFDWLKEVCEPAIAEIKGAGR